MASSRSQGVGLVGLGGIGISNESTNDVGFYSYQSNQAILENEGKGKKKRRKEVKKRNKSSTRFFIAHM